MPEVPGSARYQPGRPDPIGASRVSLAAAVTSFLIILPAELPDKTVLACLILGSRYRPGYVFAGAAVAFAVQAALAVTAGGLLGLLPHRPVQVIVSVLFLAGAVLLWRHRRVESDEYVEARGDRRGFLPVAATSFVVIFAAEFGDLTQILTANLAVKYHDPVAVGAGATLALWVAAGVAIIGGRSLLKVIPITWLTRAAALVMLALAGTSIASVFS
ncbi:MAG TPA: TMEM165/GDT1 family protein [Streptosporangiaceae bacterium]|nr:TMEM165/GDT1 family protein [Streptosporangiaceae bacterium]